MEWLKLLGKNRMFVVLLLGWIVLLGIIGIQRAKNQYQQAIIQQWEETYYDSYYQIADEMTALLSDTIRLRAELTQFIINHPSIQRTFLSQYFTQIDTVHSED